MKSGSDTKEPQRNEGRTLTKKRSMLFKILRGKSEERTKFTADSDATFKFASQSTEYHEANSLDFHNHQAAGGHPESLESHMVPDLNSSITNGTTAHHAALEEPCELPEFVANTNSSGGSPSGDILYPEFVTRDLADISTVGFGGSTSTTKALTVDDLASVQNFQRTLDIPVIATHDPNAVCIDDTLEPIQAVVTEYSQQLNDAFFPEEDDEQEEQEASLEQIVTRRQKLKRALKLKFKNNNKGNTLALN